MRIPYEVRKAVYEKAISHYAEAHQVIKAVEEMAELTNELAKATTDSSRTTLEKIADEIADVTIMMEQLAIMFNINQHVQDRIDYKVKRLAQRIEEHQEEEHGRYAEE